MTEVTEDVMIGLFKELLASDNKEKCEKKDPDEDWKAKINKHGTVQNCSPASLYKNMEGARRSFPYMSGGPTPFVPKRKNRAGWSLGSCGKLKFPLQAHHVIPKNFLPTHGVCEFLAKKYPGKKFTLKFDAPYSTDHANNGYCLPYASALKNWKSAKNDEAKDKIADDLMDITDRQLHQGSHKEYQYTEDSAEGTEDDDDEVHADGPGYLARVGQLLSLVQAWTQLHMKTCIICNPNPKATGKQTVMPRKSVVRHMDQVSGLVKVLMDGNFIFVSYRAWQHFKDEGVTLEIPDWLPGES